MKVQSDRVSTRRVGELRHAMHELNNALTPVLANAQVARLMIDTDPEEAKEALDDVVEAAIRANALVAEMRAVFRGLPEEVPAQPPGEEVDLG